MTSTSGSFETPLAGGRQPRASYEAIADHIRREISLGRLLPGDKLPAERVLAERLGVARETVRQALRLLEGAGELRTTRGAHGGAVLLRPVTDAQRARAELFARRDDLVQLMELRIVIEVAAAGLAARRRTDDDLGALDHAQDAILAAPNKDEFRRADTAFHLAVAAACGNTRMAQAIEDARAETFIPADVLVFDVTREQDHSHRDHAGVVSAIRRRQHRAAERAMHAHLDRTRVEIARLIEGLPLLD